MISVKIGESKKISVESKKEGIFLNNQLFKGEVVKTDSSSFKVYKDTKIFSVEVVSRQGKEMKLKINNQLLEVKVADHIDEILDKLGMATVSSVAVKDLKAPMPGSILNIMVREGDEVQQGDALLVLEAMKMENVLKSPGGGKVSKLHISEKENVEKNQVLISFE